MREILNKIPTTTIPVEATKAIIALPAEITITQETGATAITQETGARTTLRETRTVTTTTLVMKDHITKEDENVRIHVPASPTCHSMMIFILLK